MHAPQIIYIVLISLALNDAIMNHGKERTRITHAGATLFALSMLVGLLYWGGFFSH